LRKEFLRRDRNLGRFARKRRAAALKGVSFTIARGECVAILGQNGSGKSTLVRLLSTLLLHDGGSATIFGHDAFRETRAVRRLVNRVSVEASFFKKMSAFENLSYAARCYGRPTSQTRAEIRVGAESLADRIGILARGELLFLEPVEDVKRRYGVDTLEEAFFAATGRSFEEENGDEDRGVFA